MDNKSPEKPKKRAVENPIFSTHFPQSAMENSEAFFPCVSYLFRVFHQIHRPYYNHNHFKYEFNAMTVLAKRPPKERMHT